MSNAPTTQDRQTALAKWERAFREARTNRERQEAAAIVRNLKRMIGA